jgi:hypothetical protein
MTTEEPFPRGTDAALDRSICRGIFRHLGGEWRACAQRRPQVAVVGELN